MSEFLNAILAKLNEVFDPTTLGERFASWSVKFISGALVFLLFYIFWRITVLIVKTFFFKRDADETTQAFTFTVIKYAILIIGGINALSVMGVEVGALLTSLGIVGITVGFAARDAFSNLISGLLIFLDRPFVIGDLIEVGDNYGEVDQITLRSTRIITPDGRMLAVPNSEMINKTVASYTNFPNLRLDMDITIGVEEDIQHVRELLLGIVQEDPDFLKTPEPQVLVASLNDYNIGLELRVWLRDERTHVGKRSALREKMFQTLDEAGIDMPFETIQLTALDVNLTQN